MPLTIAIGADTDQADDLLLFPEAASRAAWFAQGEEGRLAVDVDETDGHIVVRSAIAGVRPEHIDVSVHGDMLTLRGRREPRSEPGARQVVAECHWGSFSRSLILPAEIDVDGITATLRDGVLTVRLPKSERSRHIGVKTLS